MYFFPCYFSCSTRCPFLWQKIATANRNLNAAYWMDTLRWQDTQIRCTSSCVIARSGSQIDLKLNCMEHSPVSEATTCSARYKIHWFLGTWNFTLLFTRACDWIVSGERSIRYTLSHFHFNVYFCTFPLCLCLPSGIFLIFQGLIFGTHFSSFQCVLHIAYITHFLIMNY